MNEHERLCDLMKQGLATFTAPKTTKNKPRITVACHACQNWHPENKHTADSATRKANLKVCGRTSRQAQERLK